MNNLARQVSKEALKQGRKKFFFMGRLPFFERLFATLFAKDIIIEVGLSFLPEHEPAACIAEAKKLITIRCTYYLDLFLPNGEPEFEFDMENGMKVIRGWQTITRIDKHPAFRKNLEEAMYKVKKQ